MSGGTRSTLQGRGCDEVRGPSQPKRDTGYAWVVLAASFAAQYLSMGLSIGGVGVMIVSFSKRHPDSDRAAVAWIGSLRSFQFLASATETADAIYSDDALRLGPIAVLLSARYGYRSVTVAGAVMSAIGIGLSSLATELWHVYITYGILAGVGVACTYACSTTVLDEYFDEKKNVAFPVASLGNSLGILSSAYIMQTLLDNAGHEATLYITAGLKLAEAACGVLLKRNTSTAEAKAEASTCASYLCYVGCCYHAGLPCCPLEGVRVRPSDGDAAPKPASIEDAGDVVITDYEDSRDQNDCEAVPRDGRSLNCDVSASFKYDDGDAAQAAVAAGDAAPQSCSEAVRPGSASAGGVSTPASPASSSSAALQLLRLMRHWRSWALATHATCWGASVVAVESLAPAYAVGVGIDERTAALGMTGLGGGVVLSTLAALAAGRRRYDRSLLYGLASAALGVVPFLLPAVVGESASTAAYAALCTAYGLWLGALLSLYMSVLAEYGEPGQPGGFAAHFAIYILFNGVGSLIGPASIGAIQTTSGDNAGWYACGALGLASCIVLTPVYALRKIKPRFAQERSV